MTEIRVHGRGGQGVVTAAELLSSAAFLEGRVGHGKTAARHVDAWLRGGRLAPAAPVELAGFDALNTWYYADAPRTVRPRLEAVRRESTFDEVVQGLDATTALFEARRCLSCGTCFACDNCYGVCPDNAVVKLEPGGSYAYAVDLDFCKGCGLCAQECPCGAIAMEPETVG